MISRIAVLAVTLLVGVSCGPGSNPGLGSARAADAVAPALETEDQKTLYAMGAVLGRPVADLKLTPEEIRFVVAGFEDLAAGRTAKIDVQEFGRKIEPFVRARHAAVSGVEKEKSRAYREAAAKEPGAETLPSGVIFRTVKEGTGASPTLQSVVKVHYTGTLTDGTKFDSSRDRGEPATFGLGGVIKCWTEGVQKMKVGGQAKLVCPSEVAYGDNGRPPHIPGGATLVFDVELLGIESSAAAAPQPATAPKPAPAKPAAPASAPPASQPAKQ